MTPSSQHLESPAIPVRFTPDDERQRRPINFFEVDAVAQPDSEKERRDHRKRLTIAASIGCMIDP
jgi:hypothetical protein